MSTLNERKICRCHNDLWSNRAARPRICGSSLLIDQKLDGKAYTVGHNLDPCKSRSRPVSRVLSRAVIPLGPASPQASSGLPGSTRGRRCCTHLAMRTAASLFGLAPGGVCHAVECCHRRGALLPHRFTLTGHSLPGSFGGLLSVALSVGSRPPGVTWHPARGARTFLHAPSDAAQRLPGRLSAAPPYWPALTRPRRQPHAPGRRHRCVSAGELRRDGGGARRRQFASSSSSARRIRLRSAPAVDRRGAPSTTSVISPRGMFGSRPRKPRTAPPACRDKRPRAAW